MQFFSAAITKRCVNPDPDSICGQIRNMLRKSTGRQNLLLCLAALTLSVKNSNPHQRTRMKTKGHRHTAGLPCYA